MRLQAVLDAPCDPETLYPWVADLARYPSWLDLISEVTVLDSPARTASAGDTGTGPAVGDSWSVVLSARIGPLRRSKRLRMVCTVAEPAVRARFERAEADGREHASWVLDAMVDGDAGASQLRMDLSYDGRLWGPLVERVLQDQIEAARPKLVALVTP